MYKFRQALPSLLFTLFALAMMLALSWDLVPNHHVPSVFAQGSADCSFTFGTTAVPVTGDATQLGQSNLSGNVPCVNWRITWSTTATLTSTVTFQTSADNSSWSSVPNTICSASVQPPCIIQGTNPQAGTQGMMYLAAYGSYVRVTVSSSSGAGTISVRGYGAKGASASAWLPPVSTSGFVTSVTGTPPITSTGGTTPAIGINNFTGDSGSGGAKGSVPAPAAGDAAAGKFLKASGGWAVPAGTGVTSVGATPPITSTGGNTPTIAINNFTGDSGSGGAKGSVPAPAAGDSAAGKFLAAGGGWSVPAGGSAGPGAMIGFGTELALGGVVLPGNNFFPINNFPNSTTANVGTNENIVPAGTVKNFIFVTSASQPATGNMVLTIQKNRVDTAITVTVSANAAPGTFSDLSNTVAVSNGDVIGVHITNNAITNGADVSSWSVSLQ